MHSSVRDLFSKAYLVLWSCQPLLSQYKACFVLPRALILPSSPSLRVLLLLVQWCSLWRIYFHFRYIVFMLWQLTLYFPIFARLLYLFSILTECSFLCEDYCIMLFPFLWILARLLYMSCIKRFSSFYPSSTSSKNQYNHYELVICPLYG